MHPSNQGDYFIHVGPQHPTHKEPVRWTIHVKGETIQDIDLRLGFNHRGIEKAFEHRTWEQNQLLVTRVCGICSGAHQQAYSIVGEKCAEIHDEVSDRAKYIRCIIAELERIHSHMLWYGVLGHDTGYDTYFHIAWRDRELVMDILEKISGNRVNYNMMALGGVHRDIPYNLGLEIITKLKQLRKRVEYHREVAETEKSYRARLEDVGYLSREDALRLCAVGPTLRSSGVNHDLRRDDPYDAYNDIPSDLLQVIFHYQGDVQAANIVRLQETLVSIDLIIWMLENLPNGELRCRWVKRVPPNEAIQRVEAPRGEDLHYARSNGTTMPDRYKIRAPTLANLPSTVHRLKGAFVADIPVIIRVIDPCIGCCERVIFVDVKSKKTQELSGNHLISRANRAYRLGTKILDF